MIISQHEINALIKLNGKKRYEYLVKKMADNEYVWVLDNEGFATQQDQSGIFYLPIWPEKEYAEIMSINIWTDFKPYKIQLNEFMNELAPKLQSDGFMISLFPTTNNDHLSLDIEHLIKDLTNELAKY